MKLTFSTSPRSMPKVKQGLIDPLIEDRFDVCPFCKSQRIELFSFNGYPQHYKQAVDSYLKGYNVDYNRYEIRSMRCQSCGREFAIDWSSGFPRPLRDNIRTSAFVQEFILGI